MEAKTLIEALEKKGYSVFKKDDKDYNINIVGIRSGNIVTNTFDDKIYVFWNYSGKWNVKEYNVTTDPGKYWTEHPINNKGVAILVPGQYKGTWKIGRHANKYEALCQHKSVKVYRDNNLNEFYDFESSTIDTGIFGINIHRSNPYKDSYYVDKWSAGCQVFKSPTKFKEFMDICKKSAQIFGNSFTYTLLMQSDF